MDFEAKAREVLLELLGTFSDATDRDSLRFIADALRAAALDEGAREAARAELAGLLGEVKARAQYPPPTVRIGQSLGTPALTPEEQLVADMTQPAGALLPGGFQVGATASWDESPQPTPLADIEAMQAAISANILNPGTALTSPPRLVHLLERLCWLLGLCDGERRFVAALADDAADFVTLEVFADWLEEHGRMADGALVRRLVPQDGDVIVMRYPEGAYEYQDVLKTLSAVEGHLKARGVDVLALALDDRSDLTALSPSAMRAAGWVRAADANRAQLERAARELEDAARRGGGVFATPDMLEARAFQLRHLAAGD